MWMFHDISTSVHLLSFWMDSEPDQLRGDKSRLRTFAMADGCTRKSWMWDLVGRDRICSDRDQDYAQSKKDSGDAEHAFFYSNSRHFPSLDRGPISQAFPATICLSLQR